MHVLVVEDDQKIAGFIADGLRQEGHVVEWNADGESGLRRASTFTPGFDVIVLDLMLPRLDGFGVLDALRRRRIPTPVLMLSALDSVDDRVRGLRAGADDYLVKPFAMDELTARLLAVVRRTATATKTTSEPTRLALSDLTLDRLSRRARRGRADIELQPREFALLEYFLSNVGAHTDACHDPRTRLGLDVRPAYECRGSACPAFAQQDRARGRVASSSIPCAVSAMFSALTRLLRRSLGWRISAWYAAGFILSFLLIGLFAAWIIEDSGLRAGREEIREEFQQAAAGCRQAGTAAFCRENEHDHATKPTLLRLADNHGRTLLLVPPFGESTGEVKLVELRFQHILAPGWQQVSGSPGQSFWQVYTGAMPDGSWLQVAKSDRRGDETQARLRAAVLPVALAVLLAALVGAAGLTRQALRPVRRLVETTRQVVQRGDMTARVPVRADGGNQLDELNALFNQMLARNESLIRGMREALDNVAHDLRTPLTRLRVPPRRRCVTAPRPSTCVARRSPMPSKSPSARWRCCGS